MNFQLLNELTGYHKFENQDFDAIINYMRDQGFSNSSGSFATAFIGKEFVYKCWIKDPAYEDYLEKVIKPLQGNPWVPKLIGKLHKIPLVSDRSSLLKDTKLNVQKMEILTLKKNSKLPRVILDYFIDALSSDKEIHPSKFWSLRKNKLSSTSSIFTSSQLDSLKNYISLAKKLFDDNVSEDLLYQIDSSNKENIMFRGNQPVFLDMFMSFDDKNKNSSVIIDLLTRPKSIRTGMYYGGKQKMVTSRKS